MTSPQLLKPLPDDPKFQIPAEVMDRLQSKLDAVEEALLKEDPLMPQHLKESHALLISYPETAHLLTDAGIKLIVDAELKRSGIQIYQEKVKKESSGRGRPKAGSKLTADDL